MYLQSSWPIQVRQIKCDMKTNVLLSSLLALCFILSVMRVISVETAETETVILMVLSGIALCLMLLKVTREK